jgi:Domain of unknown function (DUF4145)
MAEIFRIGNIWYKVPNKCPICHHTILIKEPVLFRTDAEIIQSVYQCPNSDCLSLFIAYYKINNNTSELINIQPTKVIIPEFPEAISKISPNFEAIYAEAEEAKQNDLLQIAGPGFRKAFEFLIKDYAKIKSAEEKYNEIEAANVSSVVKKFIPDPRIQAVAKRALWIGNDETHYLKKWENHDITDLLTLINLTINWIEIEQLSSSYKEEMPG